MHNAPSLKELVEAVKSFIDETAAPNLKGHAAFHARVASNVLATVVREIEMGAEAAADERARLVALLETDGETDLDRLNRDLSGRIRAGKMTLQTPNLLNHLKSTAISQLSIDQPRYSGAKRLKQG
ncbi:MAG: DUF6285 domain-containing protein [Pseudomonadota bacterium]